MSAHRVIDSQVAVLALKNGAVVLDKDDDVMEKREGLWCCNDKGNTLWSSQDIRLPARVLIESWEREAQ